jgi:hypothetical protein
MRAGVLPALCLALAGCLFSTIALAAGPVGTVSFLKGSASLKRPDGRVEPLAKGAPVANGDLVMTGRRSLLAIEFEDQTRFVLGAVSTLRIDRVETGSAATFSAEVLRGAFRFVTGLIAKARPGAMRVRAGVVATIGIRGTTVGGEVAEEGGAATIVLLEPEGEAHTSSVEVANEFGSVLLTETGTGTRIPDARSPPSPPERMRLRAVDNLMRNLGNMQRMTMPRPHVH